MLNLKGRIVVFSIVGCPHCTAAKSTLSNHNLPYFDVNIEKKPALREWLQKRVEKTSVPQIFFNDRYIGGNHDLQQLVCVFNKM